MSYYPEIESDIRDKFKVVLDLSNYINACSIDTSDLAAKKDFSAFKADVDKVKITKLTNVSTSLNIFKTKVDDFSLYLTLFDSEKYDANSDKIRYLISLKSSITYIFLTIFLAKIKVDSYDSLAIEKILTLHNFIYNTH